MTLAEALCREVNNRGPCLGENINQVAAFLAKHMHNRELLGHAAAAMHNKPHDWNIQLCMSGQSDWLETPRPPSEILPQDSWAHIHMLFSKYTELS